MNNIEIKEHKRTNFLFIFVICAVFIPVFYLFAFISIHKAFSASNTGNSQRQAVIFYKKAEGYYKSEQYLKSYSLLKFILNNYSLNKLNNAKTYFLLGKIYYYGSNFLIAKSYFQHIIFKYPDYSKIYSVIYYMAKCDFNLNNVRRSTRDFKFLIKKTKEKIKADNNLRYMKKLNLKSLIYLGITYAESNKNKKAAKILSGKNLRHFFDADSFLLTRGNKFNEIYLNYLVNIRSDFKKALLVLNIKNLFKPDKKDLCYKNYFEGLIFLKLKKYAFASKDFRNSLKVCGIYYYHNISILKYGESLIGENQIKAGLKLVNFEAENINYPSIQLSALKYLFKYYFAKKNYNKSLNYLSRILFNFQTGLKNKKKYKKIASKLLYTAINNYFSKHQYNKAIKIYRRKSFLIGKNNLNPNIYYMLSKIEFNKGNIKKAIYYANKYYNNKTNINSLYYLANIYYKAKKYKHSLKLANMIKLPQIKNKILFNKALNLKIKDNTKLGIEKDTLNILKENLNRLKGKEYVKTLYLLAVDDYNGGMINKSLHYFNIIIKNNYAKKESDILDSSFYYSGIIYYKLKEFKNALFNFKNAYRLQPAGKHFQYELSQIGYIYLKNKNYKNALKYYGKLEKNGSSSFYKNLAKSMALAIKLKNY
ncbi:MAG: tetratricopeptide repeat protein [bacterium]